MILIKKQEDGTYSVIKETFKYLGPGAHTVMTVTLKSGLPSQKEAMDWYANQETKDLRGDSDQSHS